jgi:hypothetical protein
MRTLFFTGCLILLMIDSFGQNGNEWIKFNQFYFKIPIAKDGLYRLTYNNLQTAGFPVDGIDPRRLQLYHRGVEQAIYVEGEGDATFNASDFIEFYGRKNDGTMDEELYQPASAQPHKYYNLYSDTTSYFLTFNPAAIFGKRMTSFSEVNVTNKPKETYHFDEKLLVINESYSTGQVFVDYLQNTYFDNSEGFCSAEIRQNTFTDFLLTDISFVNGSQGAPQLELLLMARGPMPHEAEIYVGKNVSELRLLTTNDFYGYSTSKINQAITTADIGSDGKMVIRVKANGIGGGSDRFSLAYAKLTYAQQFNEAGVNEKVFQLAVNPLNKSYIEIQNPSPGSRLYDITDPANVSIIGTTSTTTLNAIIPGTSASRKIFATANVMLPASIKQATFRQIFPDEHNYIIISNKVLMKSALGYDDPVKAYGGYRASTEGGGYDTLVVDINMLYNQFNYGEKSPLAIYHFMRFLCAMHRPDYLFIIGKGLTVDYKYYRTPPPPTNTTFKDYKDLVPTAGMPPSDMFYTVGLSGTSFEPAVPTGRITASTPTDVAAYLNKIKEMEALPFNAMWRKNVLHLSGGIHEGEPETFREYMNDFQEIAEGYHLGGKVKAIPKRSTDIQLINISEEVNKGVNLVTFFGHSSPSTIDFDIGFATDPILGYNNPGKYPTLLMNGCNAGAFFLNGKLFGEDWINASNRGAVGFIAHSSYGLVSLLKSYSDIFYSVGYGDSTFIHKGLGDIQKEVATRFIETMGASIPNITQVQQMILLGDPSVKLFGANKADYEINENNVYIESFNGAPISALTDSFALNIIVRNFGQAKEDSLLVEVTRTFNDNSTETFHKLFPPVKYSDTLVFTIYKEHIKGFGNNSFAVKVDSDDVIAELNENNNATSKNLLIPLNGTKNLFPYDYAIVNDTQQKLVFQSTDLLSGQREFLVEVDTIDSFTSQFKTQFTASGSVLVNQVVNLTSKDSLAYYWRTKLKDPLPGESTSWTTSSFTYINSGLEGWAQVHFPQYLKNESIGLVKDATFREFKFEETETDISIKTFGSTNATSYTQVSVKINTAEYNLFTQGGGCRTNTFNLLAFNKTSTVPYPAIPYTFSDPRSCGREPQVILNFLVSEMETGSNDLIQSITDIVEGDSVVLFSIGNAGYSTWTSNVKNKFGELGISLAQLSSLQDGEPVIIYGKKGTAPGTAKIFKTSSIPATAQQLQVDKTITGRYTSGKMNSVVIGPAQTWTQFIRRIKDKGATDEFGFDITGIKVNGEEALLQSDVTTDFDLSGINAADYPFLRLSFSAEDDINLTPVQLKKWFVIYEPMAEGILVYKGPRDQQNLIEGQVWSNTYGFVNITDKDFSGPLKVNVEVFNQTERSLEESSFEITAPAPGDTTKFDVTVNTVSKSGLNDVNVFVNPHILPEQYYDNNTLQLPDYLKVQGDVYSPVLDVTVDGRYLVNGDFVSPNPLIVVEMWDENKIVLKTDTTGVNIYLKYPCEDGDCDFERIKFFQDIVKWYPATSTGNFRVELNPQSLPEGDYALRIEAKDVRGNATGEDPYEVNFVVRFDQSVVTIKPYPNPSADKFFFGFTLSGAEAPDHLTLQIVTVDGKVLQELQQDKAFFHIGTNVFRWDGTDFQGNAQPDGVYIYRSILTFGGKEIRTNGKLVLIR